ncbi:glycosyltransferase family 2 protein [Dialister hominis]|jgi:glycosyltransferase involved in cell wall biosynthesis|uniref:glycosyltransferase family 2 protein n=1 Tax=Dialister hominis TaxID=2582419 RepID=UPI004029D538
MSKLLTISIAAYNVEKTIEECLNSFLPCKHFDALEILVINDGSKDRTVEIVSEYVRKYPGVIYLVNKENGGHGSTINKSLSLATGKFYKVIDGDDWVDSVELDKLCACLESTDAELVINDYMEVYPDHKRRISLRNGYVTGKIYAFGDLLVDAVHLRDMFAMHSCTILTQRLRDVHMIITEHCFYADTEYVYFVELAARTILFDDTCAYQYRLGQAGQSVSPEGIYKHIEDLIKIEYSLIQMYHRDSAQINSPVRKKYLFAIVDTRYSMLFNCFTRTIQKCDKDGLFVEFLSKVKANYPDILSQIHLSRTNSYVAGAPGDRVPLMRHFCKTKTFKILRAVKHLIKPVPNQ